MRLFISLIGLGSLSFLNFAQASPTVSQAFAHGSYAQAPFVRVEDRFDCAATTSRGEVFKFPMQRELGYSGSLAYTSQSTRIFDEPADKDVSTSVFAFTKIKFGSGFELGGEATSSTLSGIRGSSAAVISYWTGAYGLIMPDLDHFQAIQFEDVANVSKEDDQSRRTYVTKKLNFKSASEKTESIYFDGSFNPMIMLKDHSRQVNGTQISFSGSCVRTLSVINTSALAPDSN